MDCIKRRIPRREHALASSAMEGRAEFLQDA
ncbi:hypothetical protein QFZ23_004331 [Arthrobacter globiformis]|nr:hypothetical protein [Arthrobacter globiformis]